VYKGYPRRVYHPENGSGSGKSSKLRRCLFRFSAYPAPRPDIHHCKTLAPFDKVNLYPGLARLLSWQAPNIGGSLNTLAGTLRDQGQEYPRM